MDKQNNLNYFLVNTTTDVGRSCILVSMGGRNIMLDCGMHMGFNDEVSQKIEPFSHSFIICSFTLFICWFIHSFVILFIFLSLYLFIHWLFFYSFVHSFLVLFILSLIIYVFIHSFIGSLFQYLLLHFASSWSVLFSLDQWMRAGWAWHVMEKLEGMLRTD